MESVACSIQDPTKEPNTVSVLQKVKKYLENHYKNFDKKSDVDYRNQLLPPRRTNAKEQFRQAMAEKIKKEQLQHTAECNVPNDLNMFCEVCSDMWESLEETECKKYESKANEVNALVAKGPTLEDIFRVQPYIAEAMEVALSRLIGFRHNQFGKAAWVAHCMYEDEMGQVQYKCIEVHSKSKSWGSIPDNSLQLEDYRTAACTWAAQGFDADKQTIPSKNQSTIQEPQVNITNDGHADKDPKRMPKTKKNTTKKAEAKQMKDWEEKEVKEREERVAKEMEKQEREAKEREAEEQEEQEAKEREANDRAAKKMNDKAGKGRGKGEKGKKCLAEDVNEETTLPPPSKKQCAKSAKNVTSDSPPKLSGSSARSPAKPWRSIRAGKGKNPNNYKLTTGKYTGK
ncbi:hypothetical protein IW262DRAFT_1463072 [Armillaria fumosa]|nr:hypothetical protein IW262DRAFT_1463072 [Armillaria fumosa]